MGGDAAFWSPDSGETVEAVNSFRMTQAPDGDCRVQGRRRKSLRGPQNAGPSGLAPRCQSRHLPPSLMQPGRMPVAGGLAQSRSEIPQTIALINVLTSAVETDPAASAMRARTARRLVLCGGSNLSRPLRHVAYGHGRVRSRKGAVPAWSS